MPYSEVFMEDQRVGHSIQAGFGGSVKKIRRARKFVYVIAKKWSCVRQEAGKSLEYYIHIRVGMDM